LQDLDTFWGGVKLFEFSDPVFGDVLNFSLRAFRVWTGQEFTSLHQQETDHEIIAADQLACQQAFEFEYANALSRC
jgi:hypothetical protein